jgi:broad-specificity NMP kinase
MKLMLGNLGTTNQYTGVLLFSVITTVFNGCFSTIIKFIVFILKTIFVSWIYIDNMDQDGKEVYEWLTLYLSTKMENGRLFSTTKSVETAKSLNKIWYDSSSNSNFPQTRLVSGPSWSILFDKGIYFIHTSHSKSPTLGWGTSEVQKKITIYKLFPFLSFIGILSSWTNFIDNIKSDYEKEVCEYQRIYKSRSTYETFWEKPILVNRLKLSDGLFVLTEPMQEIVDDIKYFLSPISRKTFKEKGFSYCKRLCVYGPPGTGKSNLALRIAGEFDLPIYYLNCQNVTNEGLEILFDEVQRGIIIIEEIDQCIQELVEHTNNEDDVTKNNLEKKKNTGKYPRLIAWHRVLDKIIGNQVIVYVTTNNIELLRKLNHGSLIRSERIDKIVHLDYIDKNDIEKMVNKYYKQNIKLENNNYKNITPADIINILKDQNTSAKNINDVIHNMLMNKLTRKKINPLIIELIAFLNTIIEKANETISLEFVSNMAYILNKNGVNNVEDATRLLKNEEGMKELIDKNKVSLLDCIKFTDVLKEMNKGMMTDIKKLQ